MRKGQSKAAFTRFGAVLRKARGSWVLDFEMAGLRRFYLGHPLCHDVGDHVDRYSRLWSKANAEC
ncbi:hypothetical protein GmRootV116_55510 (plasmid) [Variovorax sp. V116]